jgi:Caspase domain
MWFDRKVALIVAVADYDVEEYRLQTTVNDGIALADCFRMLGFEVISSTDHTSLEVRETLVKAEKQITKNTLVVTCLLGHGITKPNGGVLEEHLLLKQFDFQRSAKRRKIQGQGVGVEDHTVSVKDVLGHLVHGAIVVGIVGMCRVLAQAAKVEPDGKEFHDPDELDLSNVLLDYSCSAGKAGLDGDGENAGAQHSVFVSESLKVSYCHMCAQCRKRALLYWSVAQNACDALILHRTRCLECFSAATPGSICQERARPPQSHQRQCHSQDTQNRP